MIEVFEPVTGISVAPTVVTEFEAGAWANLAQGSALPATVIIRLNASLEVRKGASGPTVRLDAVLADLDRRAMPAFYVQDAATADALTSWLTDNRLVDAFVIASQTELITRVRKVHPMIRGIFDSRGRELSDLVDIRRAANANFARVVLLSHELATREKVRYLQRLLMTVWVSHSPGELPADVSHFNLVASGANGIVTQDPTGLIDLLGRVFPADRVTLVRKPFAIGHRGIPELAPENTLEGARLAYQHGSDMIENDIHVTNDGEVIIHHDDTLERTTTGSGNLAARSLAELKGLKANSQFPHAFPDAGIPMLREYVAEFKATDVVHVVEVKTGDPAIIGPTVALIQEFEAEDQVVVISHHPAQLKRLQELLPGMSAGFLTFGQVNEAEPLRSVQRVLETVQPLNTTYNPDVAGLGPRFLEAAKHRGITTWPWTFKDHERYNDMFLAGVNGLTTDACHWSETWIASVDAPEAVTLLSGESTAVSATVTRYDRSSENTTPEIIVLDGAESVSIQGNTLTGVADGTAWIALRVWQPVDGDRGYFMHSAALPVHVTGNG